MQKECFFDILIVMKAFIKKSMKIWFNEMILRTYLE